MVEEQLSGALDSLLVSLNPNDPACPHPLWNTNRLGEYKSKPRKIPDQEERRRQVLARQRQKRADKTAYLRRIVPEVGDSESADSDNGGGEVEAMDASEVSDKCGEENKFNPYKNQLMFSEWLVEVPDDLATEWMTLVCPVGKRCLVVAHRGKTAAYTKSGYCIQRFPSLLPGGCRKMFRAGEYTVLDCIFSEVLQCFFIIDVMCWKGHPVSDSEAEFRFFWLRTKLDEESEVTAKSKVNPYIFKAAPCFGTSKEDIHLAVTLDHGFEIDGLLFFHKRVHYYPETTPLVGWLKPYMVKEILGVELPPALLKNIPPINKLTLIEENRLPRGVKGKNRAQGLRDMDMQDE